MATTLHKRDAAYRRKRRQKNCHGCSISDSVYYQMGNSNSTTKGLETHHLIPIKQGGTAKDGIVTLCYNCHRAIHTVEGKFNWHHVNPELTKHYFELIAV